MSGARSSFPRLQRWLHRLYEYSSLWFGLILLGSMTLAGSLLALVLRFLLPQRWSVPFGRWMIMRIFKSFLSGLAWTGACRFDMAALDTLRDQGPLILAPNHPCLLDALMLISRQPNMVCIMKADIVDNIFSGGLVRLAGYIRNDAPLSMIKQAVVALKGGSQLLLFPEGTRTTRWPINGCKGTAALIASRARVPVQTIFIETDSPYLTKGWTLFRRPSMPITYRIRLGRRFDPPDKAGVFTEALERYFIDELWDAPRFLPASAPNASTAASMPRDT